jgi:hypothetical protein
MKIVHSVIVIGVLALWPVAALAQAWTPARLTGTVRTTALAPASNVKVRIGIGPEVRTNTLGRYEFAKLPAGKWRIAVLCESVTYFHAQRLAVIDVTLDQGADEVQDFTVNPRTCQERVDTITGEFRGHWSVGFEESSFVPCPGTVNVEGWSIQSGWGGIWGTWRDYAKASWPISMPAADTSGYGDRYYVRVKGMLHGPGDFGHLSVSAYQLEIDTMLEVRTPSAMDCR